MQVHALRISCNYYHNIVCTQNAHCIICLRLKKMVLFLTIMLQVTRAIFYQATGVVPLYML